MMNEKIQASSAKTKKGWWVRFLDRLVKTNKESLQQGCRT